MDLTTPIDISSLNKYYERNVNKINRLDKMDAREALQYMTPMTGVQHKKPLETSKQKKNSRRYDGQFRGGDIATVTERELVVRPVVYEIADEPERYRDNYRIALAGGLDAKNNPFERWLLNDGVGSASEDLYDALWTAKYVAGTDNQPIDKAFDGIGTILEAGIASGDIAVPEGNYKNYGSPYTVSNIGDRLLEQYRSMPQTFKKKREVYMWISQNMSEMYDDWYENKHDNPPFVDQGGQMILEKTKGKCKLIVLDIVPDDLVMLTTKMNLVWGTDKLADLSRIIAFNSGNPYLFTAAMKYIFGTEFRTFDKSEFSLFEDATAVSS